MVAGELVMEGEDIIALIQPTEIDEQQDETFIPEISTTDTIMFYMVCFPINWILSAFLSRGLFLEEEGDEAEYEITSSIFHLVKGEYDLNHQVLV
ncbi:9558_t:CDS:2 [Entrophospora sp. SA101]|nr:9558_t:CDS:2 [Entrophospora sp. SA101]